MKYSKSEVLSAIETLKVNISISRKMALVSKLPQLHVEDVQIYEKRIKELEILLSLSEDAQDVDVSF
jgi:hypothetical protein